MLADSPTASGVACSTSMWSPAARCWVSEPAGQGLDASYATYDVATLRSLGDLQRNRVEHGGGLRRGGAGVRVGGHQSGLPAGAPSTPTACVFRITPQDAATRSDGGRCAVTLIGPGPAVVVSDTTTGQFDLVRLS